MEEMTLTTLLAQDPKCPKGIIQWQHGKYQQASNGSLVLNPFEVDGRQLMSDPCNNDNSVYTRYHQQEIFKVWPQCPLVTLFVLCLNCFSTEVRSPHQSLRQSDSSKSIRLGRSPPEPHVSRLQTTTDAPNADAEPNRRRRHRHAAIQHQQIETRPCRR